MNLIETPTAEAWVIPPGNLLITTAPAVAAGSESVEEQAPVAG